MSLSCFTYTIGCQGTKLFAACLACQSIVFETLYLWEAISSLLLLHTRVVAGSELYQNMDWH